MSSRIGCLEFSRGALRKNVPLGVARCVRCKLLSPQSSRRKILLFATEKICFASRTPVTGEYSIVKYRLAVSPMLGAREIGLRMRLYFRFEYSGFQHVPR